METIIVTVVVMVAMMVMGFIQAWMKDVAKAK